MSETWRKRLLLVAAAWNVLGGASAVADPAQHFAQSYHASLSLDDPLQLFFYRCTWINVIAWGVAYLLAAVHSGARTPVLLGGGAGKLVYSVACFALFSSGVGRPLLVTAGVVDLGFAAAFLWAFLSQRQTQGVVR